MKILTIKSKTSEMKKMKTFNIKFKCNSEFHRIRNVKLLQTSDPDYHIYKNKIIEYKRQKRPIDSVPNNSLRKFEKMSGLFEKCIFHWSKSSKQRILYWEELKYNKWKKMYSEIDFVLNDNKEKIIIGEVKTKLSIKSNCPINLYKRYNLLKCIKGLDVQCYYVKIHLDKDIEIKDMSNVSFNDMKNIDIIQNDTTLLIKSIEFSAKEVFDYGIKENIITDETFLDSVYEEQQIINNINGIDKN
jgi:hypothetical protein